MAEGRSTLATMGENQAERRRSHRVQIAMPVLIRGKRNGQPFEEKTHTTSVNAHGCMVRLSASVTRSQEVSIINPKTAEELPCTVTYIGQRDGGRTEVGIEFTEPSPVFWRIAFPPEDWDPSERKRAGSAARPASLQTAKR